MPDPIRQGDVYLIPIRSVPKEAKIQPEPRDGSGRLVLAAGEVTGHHHAIASPAARGYRHPETNVLFLLVTGTVPVALDHEEHGLAPIEARSIEPGAYEVRLQREYDQLQGWRQVLD